jgi:hypothetical protein
MGRLSRAFSRAKDAGKQKEATSITVEPVGKSESPPPPTYEQANRHEDHTQYAPQIANSTLQHNPDLPSPADCVAHLKLLECFYRLRQNIASTNGLFGISCEIVDDLDKSATQTDTHKDKKNEGITLLAEKRWQVYVSRAVERFSRWRYSLEPKANYYTLAQAISSKGQVLADRVNPETAKPFSFDAESLPPIGKSTAHPTNTMNGANYWSDVLMVWHSYTLNPRAYLEDCAREGRMRLWHTSFPLQAVASQIEHSNHQYEVDKHTMASFTEQTGLGWDNLDGLYSADVDCHVCGSRNTAPWTTYGEVSQALHGHTSSKGASLLEDVQALLSTCQGYADKGFVLSCQECKSEINHDYLCVGKLRKDLVNLIERDAVLPGNILSKNGLPSSIGKISDVAGWSFPLFPSKLMKIGLGKRILDLKGTDMQMSSVREVIEEYLSITELVKQARHYKNSNEIYPDEALALRRMISRYWENSSVFAVDLAGAVTRQGSFVQKMHDINWLDSPGLSNTVARLIRKYSRFITIVSKYSVFAVPTLDVDLAWHTHQLNPSRYLQYTVAQSKTFIDHDDKVIEAKLTDAFAKTSNIYQKLYKEPYSECTCWYCEAVRESHTSTASRLFRSGSATAADKLHSVPSDPKKSAHISTHNAVRPTGDEVYDGLVAKRLAELEKAYEKACERADKKGNPRPKRDDYYYSDAYGHPVYIPIYAPYYGAMPYTPMVYPVNPGCMAITAGEVGNCCAGTCAAGTAAGSCGGGVAGAVGGAACAGVAGVCAAGIVGCGGGGGGCGGGGGGCGGGGGGC